MRQQRVQRTRKAPRRQESEPQERPEVRKDVRATWWPEES